MFQCPLHFGLRAYAGQLQSSKSRRLGSSIHFCSFHTQPEPQVFEDLVGRRRRVGEDRHGVRCGPNAHRGGEEARLTSLGHGDVPGFMHKYMHAQNVHICRVAARRGPSIYPR